MVNGQSSMVNGRGACGRIAIGLLALLAIAAPTRGDDWNLFVAEQAPSETCTLWQVFGQSPEVGGPAAEQPGWNLFAGSPPRAARPHDDGVFAECPSPCVLKLHAAWCAPCRTEDITPELEKKSWNIVRVNCDAGGDGRIDAACAPYGVTHVPTFIVVRGRKEVARYTGSSWKEFAPILRAACAAPLQSAPLVPRN